jgi:hypothetical protein
MRLKMGTAQYYSKRSELPTGDWNEGFVFFINYHAQLFNTIEVIQIAAGCLFNHYSSFFRLV